MDKEFPFLTEDGEFEPKDKHITPETGLLAEVKAGLVDSMSEEQNAAGAYEWRAARAMVIGDKKTIDLYHHIAEGEMKHYDEFKARLADLSK